MTPPLYSVYLISPVLQENSGIFLKLSGIFVFTPFLSRSVYYIIGAKGGSNMEKNYRAELVGVFGDPVDGNPTGVLEEAGFAALG
mgnify:CR=1 FL=1